MARLRWVRSLEQVKQARERASEPLESTVRSIRVVYETHPELARAAVPDFLRPAPRPEVCVTFSQVVMHPAPEVTLEIGSAIFGVRALYEETVGIHLLSMPMTLEQAVLAGRDTYGEPKKLAEIDFRGGDEGEEVSSRVSRMGIPFLAFRGQLGEERGPRELLEHGFCVKALPACEKSRDLDGDPLLVRLDWRHQHRSVRAVEGELTLRESPLDPVADLPVVGALRAEYEEGTTASDGRVLRTLRAEQVLPFLHGRYDDPRGGGLEVELS